MLQKKQHYEFYTLELIDFRSDPDPKPDPYSWKRIRRSGSTSKWSGSERLLEPSNGLLLPTLDSFLPSPRSLVWIDPSTDLLLSTSGMMRIASSSSPSSRKIDPRKSLKQINIQRNKNIFFTNFLRSKKNTYFCLWKLKIIS